MSLLSLLNQETEFRVELAGVKDQESARKVLSTQANLTIRDIEDKVLLDGSDLEENGASQGLIKQQARC